MVTWPFIVCFVAVVQDVKETGGGGTGAKAGIKVEAELGERLFASVDSWEGLIIRHAANLTMHR